jgi:hypothetical protein
MKGESMAQCHILAPRATLIKVQKGQKYSKNLKRQAFSKYLGHANLRFPNKPPRRHAAYGCSRRGGARWRCKPAEHTDPTHRLQIVSDRRQVANNH